MAIQDGFHSQVTLGNTKRALSYNFVEIELQVGVLVAEYR